MTEKFHHFYMNSAEVLDSAFGIYKKSFWEQLLLSFVFRYGASIIAFIPLIVLYITVFSAIILGALSGRGEAITSAIWFVLFLVLLFVVFAINFIEGISLTGNLFMTKQVFYGEKKSLGKAFSSAFKSVPRCLGAILTRSLVCLIPFVFLLPLISIFTAPYSFKLSDVMIFICISLFVLSYLFIDVLFIYAFPVSINEKLTFFKAMKKGIQLLKGNFWTTCGIVTIMVVVLYIFQMSISYGLQFLIMFLSESFNDVGPVILLAIFQYLVSFVISSLLSPVSSVLVSVLYFNQKIKKDGLDIEINLRRLEGGL